MMAKKHHEIHWIVDPKDPRFMVPEKWDHWVDGLASKGIPHTPRRRIDGMTRKPALKIK
jgi:hypothetical protein